MIQNFILASLFIVCVVHPITAQTNSEIWITDDVRLTHLQDSVFMHTTWEVMEKYGRVGSNGMLVIKDGQAVMVDTPMGEPKTRLIAEYLKDSLGVTIKKHIAGHYHVDCVGGLDYLKTLGVESIANEMTITKCKEIGMPIPTVSFMDSFSFDFNGVTIQCRYFGGGHSVDNITVYLPDQKILFGGCLIKNLAATDIGANGESVLQEWDVTVQRILKTYQGPLTVIPGHGNWGSEALLVHTVKLAVQKKNQ